jgi:putative two-component system response regulator
MQSNQHLIAIIDDNVVNLKLLQHLLLREGNCRPMTFTDSSDGLAFCIANLPDLILVDFMMPGMNGIEFIGRIRAQAATAEIPVVMITASDEREVRHAALDIGATDFLTKPIDNKEVSARVRNMLRLRMAARRDAERAVWLAEEVDKATAAIRTREQELVVRISRAAEFRDPETGAHIQRMAHYSELIARHMGLTAADQQMLLAAAPMHDVGKIAIADAILLKPGRLTEPEFEIMKMHAFHGFKLLEGSDAPVLRVGAEIAHTHHEKFDGSGYPRALVGEAIPIFGRIVAVADVFDALTSARPYKKAWSFDAARDFIAEGSGTHFDPECARAFLAALDEVLAISQRFRDVGELPAF